jgi:DNA-binding transcriptional LysR family regulator
LAVAGHGGKALTVSPGQLRIIARHSTAQADHRYLNHPAPAILVSAFTLGPLPACCGHAARKNHPRVSTHVTIEELRNEEFISLHHRRGPDSLPHALRELHDLRFHEAVLVSELLEVPTVVASTDLLGLMPSSMGPLMEERFGLQVLAVPLELPALPIYMIWHEARRHDPAHDWLRQIVVAELTSPGAKFRRQPPRSPGVKCKPLRPPLRLV